jgi:hypothetical protein
MNENAEKSLNSWANPAALGFIALAVSLFSLSPILIGWVDSVFFTFTAAWGVVALIALIIVTIIFFKNRNMMLGTAFGILGILLSGGLAFKAVQLTMLASGGAQIPQSMFSGIAMVDAMVWVVIGTILIPIGYLAGYMSRPFAILVWLADIGVWMLAAVNFGVAGPMVGEVGGVFIFVLGIWFLYMGIAQLVNGTLNRAVVNIGSPLFKSPTPPSEA